MASVLWTIAVILIALWVLGTFLLHIAARPLDFALGLAVVIIIYNQYQRRRGR